MTEPSRQAISENTRAEQMSMCFGTLAYLKNGKGNASSKNQVQGA